MKEMQAKSSIKFVRKASWPWKRTKSWTMRLNRKMISSKLWRKKTCQ